METIFRKLVEMSISASWLVLAVLALRVLLKKSPKWIHVALWALVAVRLVCPFSMESTFSVMPERTNRQIVESFSGGYYGGAMIHSKGSAQYDAAVAAGITPSVGDNGYHYVLTQPDDPTRPVQTVAVLFGPIWVAGIILMMLHAMISYFRLKRKVSACIDVGNGVYICDYIDTPFILGIGKPMIYLPSSMEPGAASHVLAHEHAHIARKDHWWKPFGYLLLSIYWFNPMLWLAYILLCRDIELACDEKVIRDMELPQKKAYSEALLHCSVNRRMIAACPLAFGEVGVKERVKTVLNYKKPAFWIVVVAILALIVTGICFLTDPKTQEPEETELRESTGETPYTWTSTLKVWDIRKVWSNQNRSDSFHNTIEGSYLDELVRLLNEVSPEEFISREISGQDDVIYSLEGASVQILCADGTDIQLRYVDDTVMIVPETDSGLWETDGYWVIENDAVKIWMRNISLGGAHMLSDENREEIRRLVRNAHVNFFDPREYDDLLFVGCYYDGGRGIGVAVYEPLADGYRLLKLIRDEEVKRCASGSDVYYCDYNDLRIFLILNQSITGMEWSGAYENAYAIDTHPGLIVEYFPEELDTMYRFNYGGGATTMYMDWNNQTHGQGPEYAADTFDNPDDAYSVCTNLKLNQIDYVWATELMDVDEYEHQAFSRELTSEETLKLLNLLHSLPEDTLEKAELPEGVFKTLDIFLQNDTDQEEMIAMLSLKLHKEEVYYHFFADGAESVITWKIKSSQLAEYIESFFAGDQSGWHRFAPVPKMEGEVSCDFDGTEVFLPKLVAFEYTVSEDGIRFKPDKKEGYVLVKYCAEAFDYNRIGMRTLTGIYGGMPGIRVYQGTNEIWSFMEVISTDPIWYVPKPDIDNMPAMNVRLVNEDLAPWVEEYADQILWILMELRIHVNS